MPLADLCLAKLILAAGTSVLAQGCIGGLFVLSGKLVGLPGPLPPELPGWLFCGAVGSISVCAVQLFVSLAVRTFAPPVAFGLAGGILGLLCTAKGWGYLFPYALLCLGMRANNPTMELDLAPFLLSALCYTVAFTALSVWLAQKRDAAAE